MEARVVVYGTSDCGETGRARTHLEIRGIAYDFIDIDQDTAAERDLLAWNNGARVIPTVVITDKEGASFRIAEPSNEELDHLLRRAA